MNNIVLTNLSCQDECFPKSPEKIKIRTELKEMSRFSPPA